MLNRCSNFVLAAGLTVAIMAVVASHANARAVLQTQKYIATSVEASTIKLKKPGPICGICCPKCK